MMTQIRSFPPLYGENPHTLILGSIPGVKSLQHQQYYAHPRNSFWKIMAEIVHFNSDADYLTRCQILTANGFALWDTLACCERVGSLDSAITRHSEVANDIPTFLKQHPSLSLIACNGGKARKSFRRFIEMQLPCEIKIIQLPSTSPAYARLNFSEKLAIWKEQLDHGKKIKE